MVAPVNQRDVDRQLSEIPARRQPAESAANDDNTVSCAVHSKRVSPFAGEPKFESLERAVHFLDPCANKLASQDSIRVVSREVRHG
jgi:hypothetical protein